MKSLKLYTHYLLLTTTPTLIGYPENHLPPTVVERVNYERFQETEEWIRPKTYDDILQMLEDLESGELEKRYTLEQLERVNQYLATLAKEGAFSDEAVIEEDLYDLMYGEASVFKLIRNLKNNNECMVIPAFYSTDSNYDIVQCGKISKAWKKTKKFIKKHKKAIIIGACVVVAATAVTVAVVVATSTTTAASAAASAVGAASSAIASDAPVSSESEHNEAASIFTEPESFSCDDANFFNEMEGQISDFKENIVRENFFEFSNVESLPLEETGRVMGLLFAHESFNHFSDDLPQFFHVTGSGENIEFSNEANQNSIEFGHNAIDQYFSSDYKILPSDLNSQVDFNAFSYQLRGDMARSYGYYDQSIEDFSKAIDLNSTNPLLYLQRSASYFDLGQYDRSLEDFQKFSSQVEETFQENPLSVTDFSFGFAKGLPKGVYESGEGILLFLTDFVTHPVHTSKQMMQALSTLVTLVQNDEWGTIGEVLAPEISQLINEWESLSSDRRGELAGYAVGKHGGDILAPGAIAKIASKSAKSARELAAVCKNIKLANDTLILETASSIGNALQLEEIVNAGKSTVFIGEELGFTAKKMGKLKQTGKLEATLQNKFNHLSLPKQESIQLFAEAEKYLRRYKGFRPEHEIRTLIHKTGIPTFPRPSGIPENFRVKLSNNAAGMKYVHPKDEGTYVRVMPGKAHSKNPCQQKPYVNYRVNGESVDKFGNKVLNDSKEVHIRLEEFTYREF